MQTCTRAMMGCMIPIRGHVQMTSVLRGGGGVSQLLTVVMEVA